MTGDSLRDLSGLILEARAASQQSSEDFRRRLLTALSILVPFGKAIWAAASLAGGMSLRAPELFGIDRAALGDYERASYVDPRLATVLGSPGVALAYSARPDDPGPYLDMIAALGVAHFISIAQYDRPLELAGGLVLFRSSAAPAFTEDERLLVEAAFPHLMAGWTDSQLADLVRQAPGRSRLPAASAAAHGPLLLAADPDFAPMLRREWPGWSGPRLPAALIDPASGAPRSRHLGKAVVVSARMAVDTALVTVRERTPADSLTTRELAVARLCAEGLSYKEIARRLGVAPATVRNQIAAAHRRLGVTRNSEIGGLLAAVDTGP
jgi:DNA-binding CsgD family transcriptional regulator